MSDTMHDSGGEPHPLSYALPQQRAAGPSRGMIALVVLNVTAGGLLSVCVAPLAVHIYSCTESQKWCHIAAYVLGAPSALIVAVLAALTVSRTLTAPDPAAGAPPPPSHPKLLTIAAWAGVLVAAGDLIGLIVAVAHNS